MRALLVIVAVLAISSVACTPGEPPGSETHPKDKYRVRPEGVPVRYIDRSAGVLTDEQQEIVERFSNARPIARIGVDEGPMHEVFGEIRDVVVDEGRLYAVDLKYSNVRVFTIEGEYVMTVGGPGQGPGELFNPVTLTIDRDSNLLLVAAVGGRRLHFFSILQEGEPVSIEYDHSVTLELTPVDMCFVGDTLYMHGWKLGIPQDGDLQNVKHKIFHGIDRSGHILTSFGSVYESPNRIANQQIFKGPIVCEENRRRVYVAPRNLLGEIRAYDLTGQEPWIAVLRDFTPSILKDLPGGGTNWTADWTGYDRIEALVPMGGEHLLVQDKFTSREGDVWLLQGIHSYLISTADGTGMYVGDSLPLIVEANESHFVSIQREPFPELTVWEFQGEHE